MNNQTKNTQGESMNYAAGWIKVNRWVAEETDENIFHGDPGLLGLFISLAARAAHKPITIYPLDHLGRKFRVDLKEGEVHVTLKSLMKFSSKKRRHLDNDLKILMEIGAIRNTMRKQNKGCVFFINLKWLSDEQKFMKCKKNNEEDNERTMSRQAEDNEPPLYLKNIKNKKNIKNMKNEESKPSDFQSEGSVTMQIDPPCVGGELLIPEIVENLPKLKKARKSIKTQWVIGREPEVEKIASDWLKWALETMPWSKPHPSWTLESFSHALWKLKKETNLNDAGVQTLFNHVSKSDFWAKNALSPVGLLKRNKNGFRKIDHILNDMRGKLPKRFSEQEQNEFAFFAHGK